jgi:hypothetical protein
MPNEGSPCDVPESKKTSPTALPPMRAAHEQIRTTEEPVICVGCGTPIGADETLCCWTGAGTIVASSYLEIRRLLRDDRGPVALFHIRCWSGQPPPETEQQH